MSSIPDRLRTEATKRADGHCEYCMFPVRGQVAWFPIDHIIPRSRGGLTVSENLAVSCPRCNAHKWAADSATDPKTAEIVSLFHPRQQIWTDHFRWSTTDNLQIEGITACGRATVERLRMNEPEIVEIRRVLVELGIQLRDR